MMGQSGKEVSYAAFLGVNPKTVVDLANELLIVYYLSCPCRLGNHMHRVIVSYKPLAMLFCIWFWTSLATSSDVLLTVNRHS